MLKHGMVALGDTVVVGVSGGVDSVSLLDVLFRLQAAFRLKLVVAHIHHGLRGEEADRDLQFVEDLATRYDLPFEGTRIAPSEYPKGENTQARARKLRYRFYEEVARRWGGSRIATGHHQDDHEETLLMQILRGTGGLQGIRPVREGRYIRPLIEIRREEILAYARRTGLAFCEDSSNQKRSYLRNRIRQELIPWIRREVDPSFSGPLLQLGSILQEDARCLDVMAEEALSEAVVGAPVEGEIILRRDLMEALPRPIQRRVLRLTYRRLEGSTRGLSYTHVEGVCDGLARWEGRVHKVFSLPRGVRVFLEYEVVCFSRRDLWEVQPYEYPLFVGEERPIPQAGIALHARRVPFDSFPPEATRDRNRAWLDADLSDGEMVVRNARPGDRFRPLGLGGEKKLKDFFIDEKIPRSLRRRIVILEIEGRVGWVVGYRIDDRFKVSEGTQFALLLEATPLERPGGTLG
jgi:tRNA(Ile)-lysidine synthase